MVPTQARGVVVRPTYVFGRCSDMVKLCQESARAIAWPFALRRPLHCLGRLLGAL